MKQWSIGSGPSGTLIVIGDPDNPISTVIQNVDPANTVYLGETAAVTPYNPLLNVPLGPGQSMIATGDINVFAIAAIGQNVAVNTLRGFGNFFQQSIVNGTVIQAGTFQGLDFEINSNGAFFYEGTPGLGNLKISIAAQAGTDRFGNIYTDNIASYNVAVAGGGYAQIAANDTNGTPYFVLNPPGTVHLNGFPQLDASVISGGASNEQTQLNVVSGSETGQPGGASYLQLVSRANDASGLSLANLVGDITRTVLPDGNSYSLGRFCTRTTSTITISTSAAQNIIAVPVGVGTYRVRIHILLATGATALTSVFAINTGFTTAGGAFSLGTERRGRASTSADVVRPINTNGYPGGNSLALAASETSTYEFEGVIGFSSAGNFAIAATTSTATYAIATGSYLELLNIR